MFTKGSNVPDVSHDLSTLPEIYWRLLAAYVAISPNRHQGDALALQTLYAHLRDQKNQEKANRWPLSYVRQAVEQLQAGGVVVVENEIFVRPTAHGEALIAEIQQHLPAPPSPPPFPVALSAHAAEPE